jgi:hypothetical protein
VQQSRAGFQRPPQCQMLRPAAPRQRTRLRRSCTTCCSSWKQTQRKQPLTVKCHISAQLIHCCRLPARQQLQTLQQPWRRCFSSWRLIGCCQAALQWSPGQTLCWPLPRVGVHSGMGFIASFTRHHPVICASALKDRECIQPRTWHEVKRVSAPIMPCRAQLDMVLQVAQQQRAEWQHEDQWQQRH